MKKQTQADYYDIIKKELESFTADMGIPAPAVSVDSVTEEGKAVLSFGGFEAIMYFGDMIPYGYSFLEDLSDDIAEYCLITRFKFSFSRVHFSPYDIHNAIDYKEFIPLDFHLIRNEGQLKYALGRILGFIRKNSIVISNISGDLTLQRKLTDNYEYDMSVVSPKITKINLREDFSGYTEKYESKLNGFGDQIAMIRFVGSGKSDSLIRYFKKAEKKGKLITFERRYRDFLEGNGYQAPVGTLSAEVKAENKRKGKTGVIHAVAALLAAIVALFLLIVVEIVADERLPYTLIASNGGPGSIAYLGVMLSFWHMFESCIKRAFVGNSYSSKKTKSQSQIAGMILTVVEIAVIIGCCTYYYYIGYKPVALADNGIYYGSVKENEILPYDTQKIKFFYIDGYVDYYEEVITKDKENEAIYVVINDDYPDYYIDSFETTEERQRAVDTLKGKGVEIKVINSYEEYDKLFVSE